MKRNWARASVSFRIIAIGIITGPGKPSSIRINIIEQVTFYLTFLFLNYFFLNISSQTRINFMKWQVLNLQLSTVMFYDTSSIWQQDGSAKTFKEARVAILVISSKNIYEWVFFSQYRSGTSNTIKRNVNYTDHRKVRKIFIVVNNLSEKRWKNLKSLSFIVFNQSKRQPL